ncbi:hypothetical protein AAUPMB_21562, partial [Pasteurella multocida subsp. multocida str. Anand1_buffalo]
ILNGIRVFVIYKCFEFYFTNFFENVTAGMSVFRDKDSFIFFKFRHGIKELDYQIVVSCSCPHE